METKQIGILIEMIAAILLLVGIILILITTGVMVNVGWGLLIVGLILGIVGYALLRM